MNDIRILMPVVNANPHLFIVTHWLARILLPLPNSLLVDAQIGAKKTYLSKRAQTRQNTAADPGRVLPLRRRKDLYPHVLDRELLHLGEQTVAEALCERAASRKHNVGV